MFSANRFGMVSISGNALANDEAAEALGVHAAIDRSLDAQTELHLANVKIKMGAIQANRHNRKMLMEAPLLRQVLAGQAIAVALADDAEVGGKSPHIIQYDWQIAS